MAGTEDLLARLFRSSRANAVLSWLLVAVLAGLLAESLFDVDRLWIAFVAVTGVLVVVLSFGVVWELSEFGLDVAAEETGIVVALAHHGLDDTVRDLMFDSLARSWSRRSPRRTSRASPRRSGSACCTPSSR